MTCHPDLIMIVTESLKVSPVDFGVAHGQRPIDEQNKLYQQGRTTPGKIVTYKDGYTNKSKHNYQPSMAVDLYCWPRHIMWDSAHLSVLAGVILSTAKRLKAEGKIMLDLRWGNDWDGDGILVKSDATERFIDEPHFELI